MKISRLLIGLACLVLAFPGAPAEAGGFEYSLTPYLWAIGLDGTIGIGTNGSDPIVVDVSESFSDIFSNLDMAIPIHFEMRSPVWSLIAEVNYASLSQDLGTIAGKAGVDTGFAELLAAWQFRPSMELLFGSRYLALSTDLKIDMPPISVDGKKSWVDPLIGIRYAGQLNRRGTWHSSFRADVGGFGLGSELTWNVRLGLGYDMSHSTSLLFGYHWLDIDYDSGGFLYDILQQGPEIGATFRF